MPRGDTIIEVMLALALGLVLLGLGLWLDVLALAIVGGLLSALGVGLIVWFNISVGRKMRAWRAVTEKEPSSSSSSSSSSAADAQPGKASS